MTDRYRPLRDELIVELEPTASADLYTGAPRYERCMGRVVALSPRAQRHLGPAGVGVGAVVIWQYGIDLPVGPDDARTRRLPAAEVLGVVE